MMTEIITSLLIAIRAVESCDGLDKRANGNDYQITSVCVHDVNRIYKTNYRWPDDTKDRETAENIVMMYLMFYGVQYQLEYHRLPSREVLAKIYHCGYAGFKRGGGNDYWRKIKRSEHERKVRN